MASIPVAFPDETSESNNGFIVYSLVPVAAFLFLLLLSLLVINFIRLYRRQKMVTRQLLETESKFRELINEDRILRIGQLTASLSHELNQPLTAILSTAQAGIRFIDSDKSDPAFMKELFQNIVEDDKRAASILSSLRSMMKLEKRDKERINLNSIVEEIINVYQGETIRKNIGIELNQPELPVFVQADKTQIQQVILNFILNAIQSVEESDAKIRRIVITTNLESEYVKLSVRDFGNGIDGKIYNRLFRSFVTTKKEGTGIGLALSRSIIDDHGGKIWAENMPDGGAVFAFSLKTIS